MNQGSWTTGLVPFAGFLGVMPGGFGGAGFVVQELSVFKERRPCLGRRYERRSGLIGAMSADHGLIGGGRLGRVFDRAYGVFVPACDGTSTGFVMKRNKGIWWMPWH